METPAIQTPIQARLISHHGVDRIGLWFPFDKGLITKIKSLPDARWSTSLKCWHLPYTEKIKQLFVESDLPFERIQTLSALKNNPLQNASPNYSFTSSGTTVGVPTSGVISGIASPGEAHSVLPQTDTQEAADIPVMKQGTLEIVMQAQQFIISLPYQEKDVAFIKSLPGSWWHVHSKRWIVRAIPTNLQALQSHFAYWTADAYARCMDLILMTTDPLLVEMYHSPERPGFIAVKIKGHRADHDFLKHLPERSYDDAFKRWWIPADQVVLDRIRNHYTKVGAKIMDRTQLAPGKSDQKSPALAERQRLLLAKFPERHQEVLRQYTAALIRMRYSWNTVRGYTGAFFHYLHYLEGTPPPIATSTIINAYLATLAAKKVSEALVHTAVNSIKFYYDKVLFVPDFKIQEIQRPKQSHKLPNFLSIQEIDKLLRASENLKHTAILYALYSGGLRLSELLGLQLKDIHWDRNQIMVRDAKGKKDRSVMLSQTLKEVLRHYFDQYQPRMWLFEGQGGNTPYSAKSVQQVVIQHARKAGITKRVTPHILRHCFATHLLDNGTDVRFIQELLGHKDLKTTMIYTHITTKTLESIQSPLDQLALDHNRWKKTNV